MRWSKLDWSEDAQDADDLDNTLELPQPPEDNSDSNPGSDDSYDDDSWLQDDLSSAYEDWLFDLEGNHKILAMLLHKKYVTKFKLLKTGSWGGKINSWSQ